MRLIVVACGAKKQSHPCLAGEMYLGSFHHACARAARVPSEDDDRVMILSAKYGLMDLDEVIEPYDLRLGQPGSVKPAAIHAQAVNLGILDYSVTVLAGRDYTNLLRKVFTDISAPLAGTRGIGEMQARLASIYK